MPKNTTGGNKSKKQANHVKLPPIAQKVRAANEKEEIYGVVVKLLGGNLFQCYCIDKVTRLGHIPGKMRSSRNKKDNFIQSGGWVLVGNLGTQTKKGMEEVQLLEVYSASEIDKLKKSSVQNWGILQAASQENATCAAEKEDGIEFSNDIYEPQEKRQQEKKIEASFLIKEEINIDDI